MQGSTETNTSHISNTVKLLRIPFSYFLMPVFLFAASEAQNPDFVNLIIAFVVLHLFLYPASNAYNSFIDRDEGSIGGLEAPPAPTRLLFYASVLFDAIGLSLALIISFSFFIGTAICILASRAYSSRWTRLKKYPFIGFLTVIIFQGGFIYYVIYNGISTVPLEFVWPAYLPVIIASLLIGGVYPMTQVYQHEADKKDGVLSISRYLGIKGTFIFCGLIFLCANILFLIYYWLTQTMSLYFLFLILTGPVIVFFLRWYKKVHADEANANFKNTMRLNLIASTCLNVYFIIKIIIKFY